MQTLRIIFLGMNICFLSLSMLAQSPPRPTQQTGIDARGGSLSGRLLYGKNYKFASYIKVTLHSAGGTASYVNLSTLSDTNGRFSFPPVPVGIYEIRATADGYRDAVMNFEMTMGDYNGVELVLHSLNEANPTAILIAPSNIPPNAFKAFQRGWKELHEKNRPKKAIKHFRKATMEHPCYAIAFVQLGLAYLQIGKTAEAEESLNQALTLDKENAETYTLQGILRKKTGDPSGALSSFRIALTKDETAWQPHAEMAQLFLSAQAFALAHKHALEAHRLQASNASTHLLLSNTAIQTKNYNLALKELDELLTQFPKHPLKKQVVKQQKQLVEFLQKQASARPPN